jgi:hypothetical protein
MRMPDTTAVEVGHSMFGDYSMPYAHPQPLVDEG